MDQHRQQSDLIKVRKIYVKASKCDDCFTSPHYKINRGDVKISQPRWVGENYPSSLKRICVVSINPGNLGKKSSQTESSKLFEDKIRNFAKDFNKWDDMMLFIKNDMKNWGKGRYKKFYFESMKLDISETAFVNMMLCSATGSGGKNNAYSSSSLKNCYSKFTKQIIINLNPKILILSGSAVKEAMKNFKYDLLESLPNIKIIDTLHYAHREGLKAEHIEIEQVMNSLKKFTNVQPC